MVNRHRRAAGPLAADGRVFVQGEQVVMAYDVYNGVLLWEKSIKDMRATKWGNAALRNVPKSVQRLLVAEGDRLFVALGLASPVSVLDAATGEEIAICEGTTGPQEMRCLDGVLLVKPSGPGLLAFDTSTARQLWRSDATPSAVTLAALDGKVFFASKRGVECLDLKSGRELCTLHGGGEPEEVE